MSGRVAFVGETSAVAGFRPLGAAVFAMDDPAEARGLWPQLSGGDYGVVFVTEQVYSALSDLIAGIADRAIPAISVIPGAGSSTGMGREKLDRAIVRALGTTVPFGNEDV